MALFECQIGSSGGSGQIPLIVTCDAAFAGLTISATDGVTTLTSVCPASSPYTIEFELPNDGTWTISGTIDGYTYSNSITISEYQLSLISGFDWKKWVDESVDLDSSDYSTLEDLLADELAIRELCLVHACVDYMCDVANVNSNLENVINNDIFAKWVNLSDYALDNMYANAAIKTAMDTADKYGYGEWVLEGQVPTMTSNTAPYGEASASSTAGSQAAYRAFDGIGSDWWSSNNTAIDQYITYDFVEAIEVKKLALSGRRASSTVDQSPKNFRLLGSNDNWNTSTEIGSYTYDGNSNIDALGIQEFDVTNNNSYKSLRIAIDSVHPSNNNVISINLIQFYAWQPKGNVPVMTSNTAPYGTASASTEYNSSMYAAYKAFDGDDSTFWSSSNGTTSGYIQYIFTNPTCIKKIKLVASDYSEYLPRNVSLIASNDGFLTYATLKTWTEDISASETKEIAIDNSNYYMAYRFVVNSTVGQHVHIAELQFYGRQLSVSVPTMTSNSLPYGEANQDSVYGGGGGEFFAWRAFDNVYSSSSKGWIAASKSNNNYIQYKFPSKMVLKMIGYWFDTAYCENRPIDVFNIMGSNDNGATFTDIQTLNTNKTLNIMHYVDIQNSNEYQLIRIKCTNNTNANPPAITELQFFGKDYSEKEFETGTTKKWLYDHGVELVDVGSPILQNTNSTGDKNDEQLHIGVSGSGASAFMPTQSIDFTNYSVLRAKLGGINYASTAANDVFGIGIKSARTYSTSDHNCIANAFYKMGVNPFTLGFDITNVTDTAYPIFHLYSSSGTYEASLSEWWLE